MGDDNNRRKFELVLICELLANNNEASIKQIINKKLLVKITIN